MSVRYIFSSSSRCISSLVNLQDSQWAKRAEVVCYGRTHWTRFSMMALGTMSIKVRLVML